MSFYSNFDKIEEVISAAVATKKIVEEGFELIKVVESNSSLPGKDGGVMLNTKIVYILGHQKPKTEVKPETKTDTEKPKQQTTKRPTNPPSQEAVLSVLAAEYDPEKVIFEENNKVVKVPFSTDKVKWKTAHDKMYTLGFKYHKGPPRWVYEG